MSDRAAHGVRGLAGKPASSEAPPAGPLPGRTTRGLWVASAVAFLGLGAVGFVPLFGGPGYEIALAAGLLLPPIVALLVALELVGRRADPFDALSVGLARGALLAVLGLLTTLLHGVRVGFCDPWGGLVLYGLGPGVGALLAGLWGVLAAELAGRASTRRRRRIAAALVALAGPMGTVLLELAIFYLTPMVFAFDPFVGYFSGTLYDTVLDPAPLVSYRAASACTLLAAYIASLHLERSPDGRTLQVRRLGRPGLLAVGLMAAVASVATVASGPALGHWQTASSIRRTLGAATREGHCELVYDRAIDRTDADRLAQDCDAHLAALGRWFDVELPDRVTVFLFSDPGQKRRLMGAAGTSIAKPWRREIYIQSAGYPHPTLGHELAHVVAGMHGRGPFRIAGALAGWLPDPGRIEGVAVASQTPDSELSDREWARAMREIGVLPSASTLFGLGFLGSHAATAYTAAGAFVSFVHERFGAQCVGRWYAGEPIERLTAMEWQELERQWHAWLDQVELSEAALAQARARFDRPSVFGRRCPHVVDELVWSAASDEARGDLEGALDAYARATVLDPAAERARLGRASCLSQSGDEPGALAALQELANMDSLGRAARDRAIERLGDLALRGGDFDAALRRYADVRTRLVDEDRLRTLDVKELACRDPVARPAVVALLVGLDHRGPLDLEAVDLLSAWRTARPEDGLPDYLVARRYIDLGRLDRAAERNEAALAAELHLDRVRVEARRLALVLACALGDRVGARSALARYEAEPSVAPTRLAWAQALTERCAR